MSCKLIPSYTVDHSLFCTHSVVAIPTELCRYFLIHWNRHREAKEVLGGCFAGVGG